MNQYGGIAVWKEEKAWLFIIHYVLPKNNLVFRFCLVIWSWKRKTMFSEYLMKSQHDQTLLAKKFETVDATSSSWNWNKLCKLQNAQNVVMFFYNSLLLKNVSCFDELLRLRFGRLGQEPRPWSWASQLEVTVL